MAGIPLASAFVRIRPDVDKQEFQRDGDRAGRDAGRAYADGFYKDSSGRLRQANGKFATQAQKDALGAGGKAGSAYADSFYRDANGKLRQANGKFATEAQKRMVAGGGAAGRGFGESFNREGGGVIKRGFGKLKGELGPLLVPLGVGAAVAAIGKIGIEYENNLNIMKSVSGATAAQMEIVADKARELGADVQLPGVSAAGAAKAMVELSKAGFDVQQSMDAARGTLQLARIAHIDEGEAAEIAANAVNAFGIKASEVDGVIDQLAATANSSSVEIKEVSYSFKMAAAVFSGMQGPAIGADEAITELNTAIAILGNNGIKGSDAGTSLKQMMLQLTGPSQQAKDIMFELAITAQGANVSLEDQNKILHGSKKVREEAIADLLEMNPELNKMGDIAYDANGKMRGLRDILALTAKGTAGMTQEEKNYAITQVFGADASRAVLALLKGGLPVYDQMRTKVLQQGSAAKVAAAQNAGLGGAIDSVKGQFENAAIAIYNQVKGPLTSALFSAAEALGPLAGGIERFGNFVRNNGDTIRDWAVAIGLVTLALKLNLAILAVQAAGGLAAYIKGIKIVTGTTRLWAGAQAVLNATLLLNPIGLAIAAIVALGAALVLAYRHVSGFRNAVDAAWRGIKAAAMAVAAWFMGTLVPSMKRAWDSIASGAMWLWRNAILPAWNGIKAAVSVSAGAIRTAGSAIAVAFRAVASVVVWLGKTIFGPTFAVIRKVVEIFWLLVQVIFKAMTNFFRNVIAPSIVGLAQTFARWFGWIRTNVISPWWNAVKAIFNLFRQYALGPFLAGLNFLRTQFQRVFQGIQIIIRFWWTNTIQPVFSMVKKAWEAVAGAFSSTYNGKIKPLFSAFIGFFKTNIVIGFQNAVGLIRAAWDKLKEAARTPVAFVVTKVINPFIRGLNTAASVVGVKDRVDEIKGFATGGQIPRPGFATGGRITGPASSTDNKVAPARVLGGAVHLAGGEFIVNAKDTARALPLLKWINAGMKGGPRGAQERIGRPMTREPGDGSEGWAFKDGGLVGWVKDVWGAVTNPIDTIKKPFEAALSRIPGAGMIKDFLVGGAKKLLGGAVNWLTGIGGGAGGGNVGKVQAFVRAQAGKPYVWASAGPGGYDCSGIVSAAYNILKGRSPYSHTFSTGSLPGSYFSPGKAGPLMAGWSHPGQRPASASVGHMAGRIGTLPFESTGSRGVRVGASARKITEFANVGAARLADGGRVPVFDSGGTLRPGFNTVYNGLGKPEKLVRADGGGPAAGDTYVFESGAFSGAIMSSSSQAEDLVVTAIKSAKRKKRI